MLPMQTTPVLTAFSVLLVVQMDCYWLWPLSFSHASIDSHLAFRGADPPLPKTVSNSKTGVESRTDLRRSPLWGPDQTRLQSVLPLVG
ncbi:hypothetical protein BC827DRAFT_1214862 [Russula dissimulans]|nr:hypothetical protein BC827DRAFT_1214862 [Russula dissimulans]